MRPNKRYKKIIQKRKKTIDYGEFVCPKCGLKIDEITEALTDSETNKPIHFDCAMEMILEKETIPENAELTYLGNGTFGIVQFEDKNPKNQKKFKILKTINFETSETNPEWRAELKDTFEKTLDTIKK